jgi:hypothetical protein
MSVRRRTLAVACGAFAAALLAPAAGAAAAGAPLPSAQSGRAGAVAPGGKERFITRRAGPGGTLVVAARRSDRRVLRSRTIRGRWAIPAVTLNGGTTGLSADGRTLLLAHPTRSYPPQRTPLAVVGTADLQVRLRIVLDGFFTVDAISPDGRWAYLIEYPGENPLDYRVRALDTTTGKLAAGNVVDPRNPDEQMGGIPMTRMTSPDGRWAYTLYGGGSETFIHALDTVGRTAACIDLEMLPAESDLSTVRLRMSGDGRHLLVRDRGELVATVDRRTFAVTEPGHELAPLPASAPAPEPAGSGGGDGLPWLLVVLPVACLAVFAVAFGLRRGRLTLPRGWRLRPRG